MLFDPFGRPLSRRNSLLSKILKRKGAILGSLASAGLFSFLAWLCLADTPISYGNIKIDPPRAWWEWAFPQPTPHGMIGVRFAQLSGDLDWSRRNALMDAFHAEISREFSKSPRVDIRELQSIIREHESADAVATQVNASIVVWGRVGQMSGQETIAVFQTIIPHIEGIERYQGPSIVSAEPHDGQVSPKTKAQQLKKIAKQIAANIAMARDDAKAASELYETLLAEFPLSRSEAAALHHYAGISLQRLWERDRSKKSYLEAAKAHYDYAASHCQDYQPSGLCANSRVNLGVLYWETGGPERAIRYHQDALVYAGPDKHIVLNNLAAFYAQTGSQLQAEKIFREALVLAPNFYSATLGLARTLLNQGKLQEAERVFRKAVELNPKDHRANFLLGECLIRANKIEEGRLYQQRAAEIAPEKADRKQTFHQRE